VDLFINSTLETLGVVHANNQSSPIPFGLDSFAKMDFVSIDFVQLKPYNRKCHGHHVPLIEAAGHAFVKVSGVYHLHCTIIATPSMS
jgi:hypothetical protein